MPSAAEVDVTDWEFVDREPMGTPGKEWLREPVTGHMWLFKPTPLQRDPRGNFWAGDDWAEKIVATLAKLIGIPAASVELAKRGDGIGVISRDISQGNRLSLGNELLSGVDTRYPAGKRGTVLEYNLGRIFASLATAGVAAPSVTGTADQSALSVFAGFLMLDAWIANQDRHHGNWGVLEDTGSLRPPTLAASFDHASSLGFQLHDETKTKKLGERRVSTWARRGKCRPMAGQPRLVELWHDARTRAGSAANHWATRLGSVTSSDEASVVDAIPDARMSQPSRSFAKAVLAANRRRALDGF